MKKCECGRTIPVRPNSTIQPKKCPICLNKQRFEKRKPKERKKADEKTMAMRRADRWFSLYIRTKHSYNGLCQCFTCDKPMLISDAVCGHLFKRRHHSVRYHINNARPQCLACNDEIVGGKEELFGRLLFDQIGLDNWNELINVYRTEQQATVEFYNEMADKYKKLYKELIGNEIRPSKPLSA